ncbi:MAG: septum formation initiator family protein [Meiothermus sp.]|uniref:septum formation initiator family protein n=1 Tax=Meiothermus sp. TaxID=1955249 RepID=UPI0025F21E57|nr:septum formation initiator family protein [Meiothermus sp.]MCS7068793.1 septum formation initiator family protein [Meiothermus sp.]MCX7601148.1 septum formation initiator family protein [Meiothermus sp.]MDW8425084.1 septum formation initiator family protein [Meiothermus sp.]
MERPIYRFLHLVFALGTLHLLVLLTLELQRHFQLRQDLAQAQVRLEALEQRNRKLTDELQIVADARYREGLARQMGYVHKDELLYRHVQP